MLVPPTTEPHRDSARRYPLSPGDAGHHAVAEIDSDCVRIVAESRSGGDGRGDRFGRRFAGSCGHCQRNGVRGQHCRSSRGGRPLSLPGRSRSR